MDKKQKPGPNTYQCLIFGNYVKFFRHDYASGKSMSATPQIFQNHSKYTVEIILDDCNPSGRFCKKTLVNISEKNQKIYNFKLEGN